MAVTDNRTLSIAGWLISALFSILFVVGGWSINNTLSNLKESINEVKADIKDVKTLIRENQDKLNEHLIMHPDKEMSSRIDNIVLRLQILEKKGGQ